MLLTEFENLTGIHPDINLYRVIEREYNTGDWADKAGFCHDYKFDVDGLASRLQMAANQRLIDIEEQHKREVYELRKRVELLTREVGELGSKNECLTDDNETMRRTMQQMQVDEQKVQMYDVLEQYVLDDVDPNTIGIAVVSFVDLRRRKERRT